MTEQARANGAGTLAEKIVRAIGGDAVRKQTLVLPLMLVLALSAPPEPAAQDAPVPAIKSLRLDPAGKDYLPLLRGPPDSVTMRSGLVVLAPGKSVGRHSTQKNEEIVIVLEGRGEMRFFNGHPPVLLEPGMAAYGPPRTEHDVINTGDAPLRYVFVVAKALD
jgi:quercetin dioxygenase-like cupin family protein